LDIQSSNTGLDANDDDEDDDERRPNSDSAYLFEQMCSERISPYGVDGDSDDEDAWEDKEIIFSSTTSQRTSGKSPGGPSNGDTMNNNKQNGNKRKKLGPPLRMKLEDLERGMGMPSVGSSDEDEMEDDDDDDDSEEELPDSPQVIRQTEDGTSTNTNDDEEDEDDDEMWDKLSAARLKGLSNGDVNATEVPTAPVGDATEPWTADFDAFGSSPSAKPMETDSSWTPDFSDAPFQAAALSSATQPESTKVNEVTPPPTLAPSPPSPNKISVALE